MVEQQGQKPPVTEIQPRSLAHEYAYSSDPALQAVIEKVSQQLTSGERPWTTPDKLHPADVQSAVFSVLVRRMEQQAPGAAWHEMVAADIQKQRLEQFKQEVASQPDQTAAAITQMFWATIGSGGGSY